MANPLASIVIPVWNGAATLAATLSSAMAQSYRPAEIVVVDDGSTDATATLLASFGDRITLIRQDNQGPARARNAGAAAARGDYLSFLDADDRWLEQKLELTIRALRDKSGAVMAYCDAMQPDGHPLVPAAMAHAPSRAEMLARWWPILPSTAVIKRAEFLAAGGFDPSFRRPGWEDAEFFVRLRDRGEFVYLNQALVCYQATMNPERAARYANNFALLATRIRARYGGAGEPLLRESRAYAARALAYKGLIEMGAGARAQARRSLWRAIRLDPRQARNYPRLIRTLLPAALARALTGRTRHANGSLG
ncbi:MAG TPA: glycosyltransferase family A protein [Candidatus Binataceae bacterium]|nr:glycosyltransferase family A protein [Candidatus Binataceae bacterium]